MEELPEGWEEVLLKDIFEIKKGKKVNITENKNNESIPYVGIKNLRGTPISQYSSDKNGLICDENDLLLVWDGANCGTVGTGMSGYVGSTIARLRLNDSLVNVDYAYRFLKSNFKHFNSTTTGATIPHLDKKNVHGLKIPLPPLPVQKKIAGILEKAEKLKTWRAEADKLTDEFLKSTFMEMFGDPVKNPMGWEIKKIKEISIKTQIGPFGTQLHEEDYIENGIPLINPKHIIDRKIVVNTKQTITSEKYQSLINYHLKLNDVIMGRRGEMGRCALITQKEDGWLCGTGSLFIRPNDSVNAIYLIFILSTNAYKKKLENEAKGITMMNLNLTIINNLKIPLPPLPLQQKFAAIVRQVEQMRQCQQESKAHIDDLFNALMQKAFKGELVA